MGASSHATCEECWSPRNSEWTTPLMRYWLLIRICWYPAFFPITVLQAIDADMHPDEIQYGYSLLEKLHRQCNGSCQGGLGQCGFLTRCKLSESFRAQSQKVCTTTGQWSPVVGLKCLFHITWISTLPRWSLFNSSLQVTFSNAVVLWSFQGHSVNWGGVVYHVYEAHFHVSESVNKQNCSYWAEKVRRSLMHVP